VRGGPRGQPIEALILYARDDDYLQLTCKWFDRKEKSMAIQASAAKLLGITSWP